MEHDPLCPFRPYVEWGPINTTTVGPTSEPGVPCQCVLIQQVRNQQHDISEQNGYGIGFAAGYAQGQRDAADARARAYTLMGAAIQNGIDAERKRIHFAIDDLVNGDVLDISLREHRAVLEAIYENGDSDE